MQVCIWFIEKQKIVVPANFFGTVSPSDCAIITFSPEDSFIKGISKLRSMSCKAIEKCRCWRSEVGLTISGLLRGKASLMLLEFGSRDPKEALHKVLALSVPSVLLRAHPFQKVGMPGRELRGFEFVEEVDDPKAAPVLDFYKTPQAITSVHLRWPFQAL